MASFCLFMCVIYSDRIHFRNAYAFKSFTSDSFFIYLTFVAILLRLVENAVWFILYIYCFIFFSPFFLLFHCFCFDILSILSDLIYLLFIYFEHIILKVHYQFVNKLLVCVVIKLFFFLKNKIIYKKPTYGYFQLLLLLCVSSVSGVRLWSIFHTKSNTKY